MIRGKVPVAAGLICAALALHGAACASQPAGPQSLSSAALVHARRSPGLTWSLFQSAPLHWTDGHRISLLVALGPSNPRYGGLLGSPAREDTVTRSMAGAPAEGWTRPLGLRLAIRW